MERKIKHQVRGFRTRDGGGVDLVRVLGNSTVKEFDPILMLDSFDSVNPEEYIAGFPMHPHRGIETISYVWRGKMTHRDSLGNVATVGDGEVQWMTSGSGILHEEILPPSERLIGVQLWLNLPAKDKMVEPAYHSVGSKEIKEMPLEKGVLRVLAGSYEGVNGHKSSYLPLDYYDVQLEPFASVKIKTEPERSVMVFTLLGDAFISGELIKEKTAVKFTEGDYIELGSGDQPAHVLFMSSTPLNEPVVWGGPIVMNTKEELNQAFEDLRNGSFLKQKIEYEG